MPIIHFILVFFSCLVFSCSHASQGPYHLTHNIGAGRVHGLAWTAGGQQILAATSRGLLVLDGSNLQVQHILGKDQQVQQAVTVAGNQVASCSEDTLFFWNLEERQLIHTISMQRLHTITGAPRECTDLKYASDGKRLVVGEEWRLGVLDLATERWMGGLQNVWTEDLFLEGDVLQVIHRPPSEDQKFTLFKMKLKTLQSFPSLQQNQRAVPGWTHKTFDLRRLDRQGQGFLVALARLFPVLAWTSVIEDPLRWVRFDHNQQLVVCSDLALRRVDPGKGTLLQAHEAACPENHHEQAMGGTGDTWVEVGQGGNSLSAAHQVLHLRSLSFGKVLARQILPVIDADQLFLDPISKEVYFREMQPPRATFRMNLLDPLGAPVPAQMPLLSTPDGLLVRSLATGSQIQFQLRQHDRVVQTILYPPVNLHPEGEKWQLADLHLWDARTGLLYLLESRDEHMRLIQLNLQTGVFSPLLLMPARKVVQLAVTPDSNFIAMVDGQGKVQSWNLHTQQKVQEVALTPSGQRFWASASGFTADHLLLIRTDDTQSQVIQGLTGKVPVQVQSQPRYAILSLNAAGTHMLVKAMEHVLWMDALRFEVLQDLTETTVTDHPFGIRWTVTPDLTQVVLAHPDGHLQLLEREVER